MKENLDSDGSVRSSQLIVCSLSIKFTTYCLFLVNNYHSYHDMFNNLQLNFKILKLVSVMPIIYDIKISNIVHIILVISEILTILD